MSDDLVAAVQALTRFYASGFGARRQGQESGPYLATESQVMFELGQHEAIDAVDLRRMLRLDAGYLSRLLARFETDGLITRERSDVDGRRQVVRLTVQGRAVFDGLGNALTMEASQVLAPLSEQDRRDLVCAMETIQRILTNRG